MTEHVHRNAATPFRRGVSNNAMGLGDASPAHCPESILRFWRAVELFMPQGLPRPKDSRRQEPISDWTIGQPLPWEPGHPLRRQRPPTHSEWRHFVYLGIFELEDVETEVRRHFGAELESNGEKTSGQACMAAFAVTDSGRPLLDTYTISSLAWSLGRTRRVGTQSRQWLEGFDEMQERARELFASRLALAPNDEEGKRIADLGFNIGPPLAAATIEQEVSLLLEQLGWPESRAQLKATATIRSAPMAKKRRYSTDGFDFLNSFFLGDLGRFARSFGEGKAGTALRSYLSDPGLLDATLRVDVSCDFQTLARLLQPHHFPSGRWPSNGHWPLVLSQQVAVNHILHELGEGAGVVAVNGPPGTGKTTLLRDLVAAVVVRRADALAGLRLPTDAFSGRAGWWQAGMYRRSIQELCPALGGSEIVVASSNNGAVENVTREIPAERAVDPSWLSAQGYYFADIATAVIGEPAWALLAAPLGNKQNRSRFVSSFWFGISDQPGDQVTPVQEVDDQASELLGFRQLLQDAASSPPPSWPDAVRRYHGAVAAVERLRNERQAIANAIEEVTRLSAEAEVASSVLDDLETKLEEARERLAERHAQLRVASEQRRSLQQQLEATNRARPSLLAVLFSLGKAFKEWSAEAKERRARLDRAIDAHGAAERAAAEAAIAKDAAENRVSSGKLVLKRRVAPLRAAERLIMLFRKESRTVVADDDFWNLPSEQRELQSPWMDEAWNDARAWLFVEALELHRAFIFSVPDMIRRNLQGAMDILTGQVPATAPRSAIRAAWSTLFLVVPVVSTTFASFDRLFSHLREEELGWLLIDEAGQAVPQAAVGAMARSRRVLVVGDPLQLEPVVPIPETLVTSLRSHFAVDAAWDPKAHSVQSLADRTSRLGTYLRGEGDKIWVGTPLRVHRRCDEPMFSVANHIAYGGLMVFGTPKSDESIVWPASAWYHVEGSESDGNWIAEEGRLVLTLLPFLSPLQKVACISPFRHVVYGLRELVARDFPELHIGTVHTFQGKERQAIILVLGGNVNREGALNWAARQPNLLNVAITRAQRRLYVVGNRQRWRTRSFFSELARRLPGSPVDLLESRAR